MNVKESDHNVIITEFTIETNPEKKEKIEMYNLKNKDCQRKFKDYTTNTNMLSTVFDNDDEDVNVLTKRFLKKLDGAIAMSFKKNRIGNKRDNKEEVLYDKRRELKDKPDAKSKSDLEEVNNELARLSKEKFDKI